MIKTLFFLVYS